jgi:LmbE family N-acetylglucosaminyl deacetylase
MATRAAFSISAVVVMVIAVVFVISLIVLTGRDKPTPIESTSWPQLTLDPADRLLILAPHPDDEVLGCGGVLQQAVAMRLPVRIVFLTYGDFYEWSFIRYEKRPVLTPRGVRGMGEIRHGEALAADATLGVPAAALAFLGYPDFGTLKIWDAAWGQALPVRGLLSRATAVPYPDAYRPGAPYKGEEVLKDLTVILREFRPTRIFVSHPADHHPDHRALYLFTRVALFDLAPDLRPEVYPYLVHYTKWPAPFGRYPREPLEPPVFLRDRIGWQSVSLDARQVSLKADALKKHKTQYETTPKFLDSFVRRNELFGDFPPMLLSRQTATPPETSRESSEQKLPTEKEPAHLVGAVTWSARIEDEKGPETPATGNPDLVFSIQLSRPLAKEVGCSVYLFGYRGDTPFPEMPKLHIALGELTHSVFDGDRKIAGREIRVQRSGRDLVIRVPLSMLRQPQRILATAQLHAGPIPLEWTAWRILELDATAR